MKKVILALTFLCVATCALGKSYGVHDIPNVQRADRTRYVSNPDGILAPAAVAHIDSVCASLRDRNIAQVAVVAVEEIAGDDVFEFAMELFGSWGVGRSDRNNGLGILLVRDRHEIRFVTGTGLEGVLPDAICKRIQMKYMLPAFRIDDYNTGMVAGIEAIGRRLEGSEVNLGGTAPYTHHLSGWSILFILTGVMLLPLLMIRMIVRRNKRCPYCHKATLRLQSAVEIDAHGTSEYTYVCSHCGHTVKRRVRRQDHDDHLGGGGFGGGVFMGGGFGGGFGGGGSIGGGFGGGGFGGGGAGSRW